jgi:pimeloyl-ACP methyl ester carboxylesterase
MTPKWDIAYALAADHPGRVDRLAVAEAVLRGISPSPPLFLPGPVNQILFHLMFNRLPTMNDQLVHRREDIFFGFICDVEAFKKLPGSAVRVYIDDLADSLASLRGSFGFYRAWDTITAQNQQRAATKLTCRSWRSAERKAPVRGRGRDDARRDQRADPGHPRLRPFRP